jgi:hypothetical protein
MCKKRFVLVLLLTMVLTTGYQVIRAGAQSERPGINLDRMAAAAAMVFKVRELETYKEAAGFAARINNDELVIFSTDRLVRGESECWGIKTSGDVDAWVFRDGATGSERIDGKLIGGHLGGAHIRVPVQDLPVLEPAADEPFDEPGELFVAGYHLVSPEAKSAVVPVWFSGSIEPKLGARFLELHGCLEEGFTGGPLLNGEGELVGLLIETDPRTCTSWGLPVADFVVTSTPVLYDVKVKKAHHLNRQTNVPHYNVSCCVSDPYQLLEQEPAAIVGFLEGSDPRTDNRGAWQGIGRVVSSKPCQRYGLSKKAACGRYKAGCELPVPHTLGEEKKLTFQLRGLLAGGAKVFSPVAARHYTPSNLTQIDLDRYR